VLNAIDKQSPDIAQASIRPTRAAHRCLDDDELDVRGRATRG